jgi:hypothetical protein
MRGPKPHRDRRTVIIVVLAVLLVVATATAVTIAVLAGGESPRPAPSTPPSAGPATTGTASAAQPTTASVSPTSTPASSQPAPFAYQPLWPFGSQAEVEAWQNAYRTGGHSPWHLDADATALAFTTGYLKFTGIDVVVSRSVHGTEALVAVGYPIENHEPGTAAVLHLARYGTGADAPWEVVGTRDTTLTINRPHYGTAVRSPVMVGGRITGVDENIRVQVRQPATEQPLGQSGGVPAGGQGTPWSTTVAYQGATAPALTVVAYTGGHYTDVERFAVTAVRTA